jgi:hypothetical protein
MERQRPLFQRGEFELGWLSLNISQRSVFPRQHSHPFGASLRAKTNPGPAAEAWGLEIKVVAFLPSRR